MSTFLLSSEKIETSIKNAVAYRIHYNSTDLHSNKTESTGLVITPSVAGNDRKVLSWAHGTTGIGDAGCPSLQPDPARELVSYFDSGSHDYHPDRNSMKDGSWYPYSSLDATVPC
jgi:hypothetical protein